MRRYRSLLIVALVALAFALDFGSILQAQVGKGSIVDVNTAAEKDLPGAAAHDAGDRQGTRSRNVRSPASWS